MLLYHFPLISDYRNLGFAKLFKNDGNEWNPSVSNFASGGMIASTAKGVTAQLGTANLLDTYEQFTILARIFNSTSSAGGDIFVINVATTGKGDIDVQLNNSDVIRIGINNYTTSTFTWEVSKTISKGWHSIAVTFDRGTAKFYVDNICEGTINDISYNRQYRFYGNNFIGNNNGTNHLMQDFRMYDYALSQAEINEYSRALVVHYPLQGNELNPSVLRDVSGFGNDMPYFSGDNPTYIQDNIRGQKCCSWNKIGRYRHEGNFLPPYDNITFAMWYKTKHVSNSNFVFLHGDSYGSPNVIGFYDQSVNNTTYFYIRTTGSGVACWTTIPNDNKWHHLVFTFVFNTSESTAVGKCYVDGEIKQTRSISNTLPNHTTENLNSWLRHVQREDNRIVDYRVYATALSAEDIKNLYNSPIAVSNQHQTMAFEFVEGNDGFSAKMNGIVQHNELRENDSDVNGCYNDKLITNELIEN